MTHVGNIHVTLCWMCRSEGHVRHGAADQRTCQTPRGLQAHHAHLSERRGECQGLQVQRNWEYQPGWVMRWRVMTMWHTCDSDGLFFFFLFTMKRLSIWTVLACCSYSSGETPERLREGLPDGSERWGPVQRGALPRRRRGDEVLRGGPPFPRQRLQWARQHQPQSAGAHKHSKTCSTSAASTSSPTSVVTIYIDIWHHSYI